MEEVRNREELEAFLTHGQSLTVRSKKIAPGYAFDTAVPEPGEVRGKFSAVDHAAGVLVLRDEDDNDHRVYVPFTVVRRG